jgi:hypothetical protein
LATKNSRTTEQDMIYRWKWYCFGDLETLESYE